MQIGTGHLFTSLCYFAAGDSNLHSTPNAFDWTSAFPQVFASDDPGFDAVIGNPPYIRIQTMQMWMPETAEYFKRVYYSARTGNYDIYVVFVELKPEKEWYLIDELIRDVLDRLQPLLQDREVQTSLPVDLPPVELDYLALDQVLTNLIENAVHYTPASSPFEISVQREGEEVKISVADRGPGIPFADLERIFDKFYRVQGTRYMQTARSGSGLGLAVCRGLVEAYAGRIWAENRAGGGAVFHLTLPTGKKEERNDE